MLSLRIAVAAVAAVASAHRHPHPSVPAPGPTDAQGATAPSCPIVSTYSCELEADDAAVDTCCSPSPGGLIVVTQFWAKSTGLESSGQLLPKGSWGMHGLWPDNCDGSFEWSCDPSRQYAGHETDLFDFFKEYARDDLLDYMNSYWINKDHPNVAFWAHEYSKHATCLSTFDKRCYTDYTPGRDAMDYFETAIRQYERYPTYKWLEAANIVPHEKKRYPLADVVAALEAASHATPFVGCYGAHDGADGRPTKINEVWYFNHVKGSPQTGEYTPVDALVSPKYPGHCSEVTPLKYLPRNPASERVPPVKQPFQARTGRVEHSEL